VHSFIVFIAILVLLIVILLKNLLYDLVFRVILKKLSKNTAASRGEKVLNNFYNGLEDDQLTREYDKTVSEIKLVKERISDAKLTKEDDLI